jgi:hypothetical protein
LAAEHSLLLRPDATPVWMMPGNFYEKRGDLDYSRGSAQIALYSDPHARRSP